jgi:hypothetical protein
LLSYKRTGSEDYQLITELAPTQHTYAVDSTGFATGQPIIFKLEARTGLQVELVATSTILHVAKPDPVSEPQAQNIGELIKISWLAPNSNGSALSKLSISVRNADGKWIVLKSFTDSATLSLPLA